jgi:hypothetical protein
VATSPTHRTSARSSSAISRSALCSPKHAALLSSTFLDAARTDQEPADIQDIPWDFDELVSDVNVADKACVKHSRVDGVNQIAATLSRR